MIKAALFDIDGTLISFETHRIPDSTKNALIQLCQRVPAFRPDRLAAARI